MYLKKIKPKSNQVLSYAMQKRSRKKIPKSYPDHTQKYKNSILFHVIVLLTKLRRNQKLPDLITLSDLKLINDRARSL